jgi:hypothetical protein
VPFVADPELGGAIGPARSRKIVSLIVVVDEDGGTGRNSSAGTDEFGRRRGSYERTTTKEGAR